MKMLARRLGVPLYSAIGILELLWHATSRHATDGGIGKFSDEEIAATVDWDRDATELIEALVAVRFLDRIDGPRLVVHDWPEHCEDSVHASLARERTWFADGSAPRLAKLGEKERTEAEKFYEPADSGGFQRPSAAENRRRPPTADSGRRKSPALASAFAFASSPEEESPAPADADATDPPLADDARASPPDPSPCPDESPPPPQQRRKPAASAAPPPSAEATMFARDFADALRRVHPSIREPTQAALRAWSVEADRMLRIDQRAIDEARALAEWLFAGAGESAAFWRANVLSVPKFRAKYDQLVAHSQRDTTRRSGGAHQPSALIAWAHS